MNLSLPHESISRTWLGGLISLEKNYSVNWGGLSVNTVKVSVSKRRLVFWASALDWVWISFTPTMRLHLTLLRQKRSIGFEITLKRHSTTQEVSGCGG